MGMRFRQREGMSYSSRSSRSFLFEIRADSSQVHWNGSKASYETYPIGLGAQIT